jgi:hypothetical protein
MEDRVHTCAKWSSGLSPSEVPMGRSASSSASALIQQPAASMLDNWLFIFDIDDKLYTRRPR